MTVPTLVKERHSLLAEWRWWHDYLYQINQTHHGMWVWEKAEEWLSEIDAADSIAWKEKRRILVFSTLPYWVNISLPTAITLIGYNCNVDFAWLPFNEEDSELNATNARDVCHYFWWSLRLPRPKHPRLRIHNLLHSIPARATEAIKAAASSQSYTDTQRLARREEIDLQNNLAEKAIFDFRYKRNLRCMLALERLFSKQHFDSVLIPNGSCFEFGAAYKLAQLRGIPAITFEASDRKGSFMLSRRLPCPYQEIDERWIADEPHILTPDRKKTVDRIFQERSTPNDPTMILPMQSTARIAQDKLLRSLKLDPNKPVALLCTNVSFDSPVLGRARVFSSMADWVRKTIDFFKDRSDWQLILRAHPGEVVMKTAEPLVSIVHNHIGSLPEHIKVIGAQDPVNTYDLMDLCKLGIIYCTTVGLELAAFGKPVVVVAEAHYARKGFTIEPETYQDYLATLNAILQDPVKFFLTARQIELAQCYFDLTLSGQRNSFPWHIWTLFEDLNERSITYLLSPKGREEYSKIFDFLAGREVII